MNAIVYTSNTGYTAQYARLLSKQTGLPAHSLDEAEKVLPANSAVLYLGWLMASSVQGYRRAKKRFRVQSVVGVGMGGTGSQLSEVKKANDLPETMPVFTVQGGFDLKRLRGMYRFMMKAMAGTLGKRLAEKTNRTPDEDTMLDLLLHGGSYVSLENLSEVLDWFRTAQRG